MGLKIEIFIIILSKLTVLWSFIVASALQASASSQHSFSSRKLALLGSSFFSLLPHPNTKPHQYKNFVS